jgi:hypothetical protein
MDIYTYFNIDKNLISLYKLGISLTVKQHKIILSSYRRLYINGLVTRSELEKSADDYITAVKKHCKSTGKKAPRLRRANLLR